MKWISAKEKLPDGDHDVLVYVRRKNGSPFAPKRFWALNNFHKDDWEISWDHAEVTHWMEIEPPEDA